jgi:HTH-type transcriptional regulator / antitoxin HigA
MDISPIKSQRDYRKVLKEIEGLMIAKRNTPEGDRLDVLVTLVEAWERKHYPMDLPDPVEAIKYHMDQNGLQPQSRSSKLDRSGQLESCGSSAMNLNLPILCDLRRFVLPALSSG